MKKKTAKASVLQYKAKVLFSIPYVLLVIVSIAIVVIGFSENVKASEAQSVAISARKEAGGGEDAGNETERAETVSDHTAAPREDGLIEFGEDGVPLGEWRRANDSGELIFDAYLSPDEQPQIGATRLQAALLLLLSLAILCFAILYKPGYRVK